MSGAPDFLFIMAGEFQMRSPGDVGIRCVRQAAFHLLAIEEIIEVHAASPRW
jgi:hypothetical protein